MSKVTLEFTLPEDREELELSLHGGDYHAALFEVSQRVFRPARKHGYSNARLQQLVEKLDEAVSLTCQNGTATDWPADGDVPMNATDLIHLLEKEFYQILDEYGVEL